MALTDPKRTTRINGLQVPSVEYVIDLIKSMLPPVPPSIKK